jgi:hypothetical protein
METLWPLSGNLPNGNFNPDNGQVNLNWNNAGNRDSNLGVRPSVRGLPLGYTLCPTTKHATDIVTDGTCLK